MKCHKYTLLVSADYRSSLHGCKSPQNRLYIPDKGVLGYNFHEKNKIDYFLDNSQSIKQGKQAIAGTLKDSKYLGEIDLPEKVIEAFITSAKLKKQAEKDFQKKGKTLISLLN